MIESAVNHVERESTLAGRIRVLIEAAVHAQGQDRSVAAFWLRRCRVRADIRSGESNHDSREFNAGT